MQVDFKNTLGNNVNMLLLLNITNTSINAKGITYDQIYACIVKTAIVN